MKLPKQLKIGGHKVRVQLTRMPPDRSAEWDSRTNTIRIDPRYPKSQQERDLIHEIFHAMNAVIGDKEVWHALMDSLAEQFYQVLSDNKLLR